MTDARPCSFSSSSLSRASRPCVWSPSAQNLPMRRVGVSGPHPCDIALVRAVAFLAVQQASANGRAPSVDAGIRRWSQFDGRKWIEGEVLKD